MTEQRVVILTGLPYSGKSTFSQELASRFGHKIVSVDDVIEEKKFNVGKMTQADWNLSYSEAYKKLRDYLAQGHSVVVDIGNLLKNERDNTKAIAQSMSVPSSLVYLNTPIEEIRRRWILNEQNKNRESLDWALIEEAIAMFEEPTDEENPIIFNHQMNLDYWLKEHLK